MLHAHLVFITKYRGKVLNDDVLVRMETIMKEVCLKFEVELTEFNGEQDHVHH
jgi:putative transposase